MWQLPLNHKAKSTSVARQNEERTGSLLIYRQIMRTRCIVNVFQFGSHLEEDAAGPASEQK